MVMGKMFLKKRILFPIIFSVQFLALYAAENVWNLELENTLLGGVFAITINVTFVVLLIKIYKDHKDKLSTIKIPIFGILGISIARFLYYLIVSIFLAFVLGTLIVLFEFFYK